MRTKYSNPYFKNEDMHNKLLAFIEKRRPKLSPNPNINQYDEDQLPVPDKTNKTQASWLKSPSSVYMSNMNVASRGPFNKSNLVSVDASTEELPPDSIMNQS